MRRRHADLRSGEPPSHRWVGYRGGLRILHAGQRAVKRCLVRPFPLSTESKKRSGRVLTTNNTGRGLLSRKGCGRCRRASRHPPPAWRGCPGPTHSSWAGPEPPAGAGLRDPGTEGSSWRIPQYHSLNDRYVMGRPIALHHHPAQHRGTHLLPISQPRHRPRSPPVEEPGRVDWGGGPRQQKRVRPETGPMPWPCCTNLWPFPASWGCAR